MEFIKNNLYVLLLIILLAAIAWIYWPKADVKQERLTTWITDGYTQQFCKIIYPKIAGCVTFTMDNCNEIAAAQISACLDSQKGSLPSSTTSVAAKKLYDSLGQCFQTKIHDEILNEYLVDTPECQERMQ